MTAKDRIHIEPREASLLDFYAATNIKTLDESAGPRWPGPIEQITAEEPKCAAYRKYMERVRADACNGDGRAKQGPKKAPKVPRDTEPMHLIEFLIMAVGGISVFCLAGWACGWSVQAAVKWIGGAL